MRPRPRPGLACPWAGVPSFSNRLGGGCPVRPAVAEPPPSSTRSARGTLPCAGLRRPSGPVKGPGADPPGDRITVGPWRPCSWPCSPWWTRATRVIIPAPCYPSHVSRWSWPGQACVRAAQVRLSLDLEALARAFPPHPPPDPLQPLQPHGRSVRRRGRPLCRRTMRRAQRHSVSDESMTRWYTWPKPLSPPFFPACGTGGGGVQLSKRYAPPAGCWCSASPRPRSWTTCSSAATAPPSARPTPAPGAALAPRRAAGVFRELGGRPVPRRRRPCLRPLDSLAPHFT
jgi:hypothetical protein